MKVHPLTAICFLTIILLMILIYEHPIYIISILLFLLLFFRILMQENKVLEIMRYALYNVVLIIIINPLLSQSGRTVIFRGPKIPVIGKIKITVEAIAFGADMGLKLICIFLVFFIYGLITSRDDNFGFFSKFTHKLTLTFSMTANIVHRLRLEALRVKDVMQMRGVKFNDKSIKKRALSYYPLLKVILISALEGSIDRAEALHSRNYGKHKRSSYINVYLTPLDYGFLFISLCLGIFLISGFYYEVGRYQFYPELQGLMDLHLPWIITLNSILIIALLFVWRVHQWKFSK